MELRISRIPVNLPLHTLKSQLVRHLGNITYDFLVIVENSCEDLLWEAYIGAPNPPSNTARVVISNIHDGTNPGLNLLKAGKIWISGPDDTQICLEVAQITSPTTTRAKFEELRAEPLNSKEAGAIPDGAIGKVVKVSCGTFDQDNTFEEICLLSSDPRHSFTNFSYLGDAWPKKFQIWLTESTQGQQSWEWMDFRISNVRGLLFDNDRRGGNQVVYLVVARPPQYYRRARAGDAANFVRSRIPYPSLPQVDANAVCGTPWGIQYSRVYRVEYQSLQQFTLSSFRPRLSRAERNKMFAFHFRVAHSMPNIDDMRLRLGRTKQVLERMHLLPQHRECALTALKLLYNGNIFPTSPDCVDTLELLYQHYSREPLMKPLVRLGLVQALEQSVRDMETNQLRALRRLYAFLPENVRNSVPHPVEREVVNPKIAVSRQLRDELFDGIDNWDIGLPVTFEIVVFPTHLELRGPISMPSNSVVDTYQHEIARFVRVKFVNDDGQPLRAEPGTDLGTIIDTRVVRILNNELPLLVGDTQRSKFLGYSLSGLKKRRAVWFFRENSAEGLSAADIRNEVGHWNTQDPLNRKLAYNPSKWGARLALAFTESVLVMEVPRDQWILVNDEGESTDTKFPNTDGCGLISHRLCNSINQTLRPLGFEESRAFQFRLGGFKGVVYSGVPSLISLRPGSNADVKMCLRKSQLKFQVPDDSQLTLRVVSTAAESKGHQSLFFSSILKALEDSGADDEKIMDLYRYKYAQLRDLKLDYGIGLGSLQGILRVTDDEREPGMKARHALLKLAIRLRGYGVYPEHYPRSFLYHYLIKLAEQARDTDPFKIPIPGSHFVMGLTDDFKVLEPNEVYVRAQGEVRAGPVLIYRDPVIHVGDIQQATAVTTEILRERMAASVDRNDRIAALEGLDNIIFFSQKDDPPLPHKLSGGDLDGDRFEVLTNLASFWEEMFEVSLPADYAEDEDPAEYTQNPHPIDFDPRELARFVGEYIKNDCFAELQDTLMCLADQKGMRDPDVQALGKWLSKAVDYAKSGERVNLTEDIQNHLEFQFAAKPDFLRALSQKAFYDSKGEYYQSQGLLGRIYRMVKDMQYICPQDMDNSDLSRRVTEVWLRKLDSTNADLQTVKYKTSLDNFTAGVSTIVTDQFRDYIRFLKEQHIPRGSETDIFLRRQLYDFPDQPIRLLKRAILNLLSASGKVIKVEELQQHGGKVYTFGDTFAPETVERIYGECLYRAWTTSFELAKRDRGYGHSYALLCLYALFCQRSPIVRTDRIAQLERDFASAFDSPLRYGWRSFVGAL